jgi:hypothetical protein
MKCSSKAIARNVNEATVSRWWNAASAAWRWIDIPSAGYGFVSVLEAEDVKYDTLARDQMIQYGVFKLFCEQDAPILAGDTLLRLWSGSRRSSATC